KGTPRPLDPRGELQRPRISHLRAWFGHSPTRIPHWQRPARHREGSHDVTDSIKHCDAHRSSLSRKETHFDQSHMFK
ncbi:Hypothetical protein SMAX5B_003375, partial [Scophthalmus maximus]